MKKTCILFLLLSVVAGLSAQPAASNDFPLLSQGVLEPPPPPPGYDLAPPSGTLPPPAAPGVPMLPPSSPSLPNEQPAAQMPVPPVEVGQPAAPAPARTQEVKVVQAISKELYEQVKHMMRSIYTFRSIVDQPESGEHLRRIQNLSRICSEMLELHRYPVPSRFVPSHSDKVLRDRSYEAVEYRHFGDFDQRINGWIKPIDSAIYIDLVFDGRGRRRTHVRAQVTRNGTFEGHFYAYGWDKFGRVWKLQGTMSNLLSFDNGLPYSGEVKIFGADPTGKTMALQLQFPVKVQGIAEPVRKPIRHHKGNPVSIGN
ncbi:MAG: hypothetical protein ACOYXC_13820 [Candidatus Rifleibacteriota bacterium]